MFEFKMPSMGADMTSAILVAWNYEVGDQVKKGDILCEIETAKGDIDVEVWESGTVAELLIKPGQKVPVGETMARIDTGAAAAATQTEAAQVAPDVVEKVIPSPEPAVAAVAVSTDEAKPLSPVEPSKTPPASHSDVVLASPAARARARELGVSLSTVQGSGPDGAVKLADLEAGSSGHHRVTPTARKMAADKGVNTDEIAATGPHDTVLKADVERAVAATPSADERAPSMRDAIARAMEKSKREIPHYYLKTTVDVSHTLEWIEAQNAERSLADRLLFSALTSRAVALAAIDVPEMNGFYINGEHAPDADVHLGFAISHRDGGVVAPAILQVQALTLDETMQRIKDVVRRTRRGKLTASEMTRSTITVTSMGDSGVDTVFGVIYPPQVAIVGIGSPRPMPFAKDGMVGVHTCVDITLSADHRVSDGLSGARFLQKIQTYLEHPENL